MEQTTKPTTIHEATASRRRRKSSQSGVASMKDEVSALKRERILEEATQLILKCGYHGTSMDAIAKAIGVTKPFIYYQFRDKGEILAAISSLGAELTLSALDQAEALDTTATDRMRWFCVRFIELVVDWGHYLAVYLRETANLEAVARKNILRLRGEIDVRVTKLITAGVESAEFRVYDAAIAARSITIMISYIFLWHRKDQPPPASEFTRIMADIAMRTLCAGSEDKFKHNQSVES